MSEVCDAEKKAQATGVNIRKEDSEFVVFFFQAEDGIRDRDGWLEFRRVLFRSEVITRVRFKFLSYSIVSWDCFRSFMIQLYILTIACRGEAVDQGFLRPVSLCICLSVSLHSPATTASLLLISCWPSIAGLLFGTSAAITTPISTSPSCSVTTLPTRCTWMIVWKHRHWDI